MKAKWLTFSLLISLLMGTLLYAGNGSADTPLLNDAVQSYDSAAAATLYLRVLNADGSLSATGSGAIISAGGSALTAYHVVKKAQKIEGVLSDGSVIAPIKVTGYDETTDAAVLELPDPKTAKVRGGAYPFLPVRTEPLKFGEKVFAVGYPLKATPIITEGIVNNPKAKINGRDRVLTSAQIVSGMSGGPLIDGYGKLVGTISGSLKTMNNIHLVIDTRDIGSLLPARLK